MSNMGDTNKNLSNVFGEQALQNAIQVKLNNEGFSNVQTLAGMPVGGNNRAGADAAYIAWKNGENYLVLGDNKDWQRFRSDMMEDSQVENWVTNSLNLYPEADVVRFYLSSTTSDAGSKVDQNLRQELMNRISSVADGRSVEIETLYKSEMEKVVASQNVSANNQSQEQQISNDEEQSYGY
jgi:hypothetical protein